MISITDKETKLVKLEKRNIAYITCSGGLNNFYSSIEKSPICKVFLKNGIDDLSLESYDAYIIDIRIFWFEEKK